MSADLWQLACCGGLDVPAESGYVSREMTRSVLMNLMYHADANGMVWVSDRTQAEELRISRSSVQAARRCLINFGWLIETDQRGQKGVRKYQIAIPDGAITNLRFARRSGSDSVTAGPVVTPTAYQSPPSGLTDGLSSGASSCLSSGLVGGRVSGTTSGSDTWAQKDRTRDETDRENTGSAVISPAYRARLEEIKRTKPALARGVDVVLRHIE
jgi:hypothetical protein